MKTFRSELEKNLKDPAFRKEWEDLEEETAAMLVLLKAREEMGLTQKEVSERTGIHQAVISKLETGERKPTLKMLKKLAWGLGKTLKIEIV